ncbi:hypothetical protein [Cryobacterium sp. BB307]|uniref:hypothetical protein n=1 Tax=Cryobacterium sp. BB307 TaxID=2716317 RepID=UPI0014465D7E|nr:hypothetical protein [Cryobacterium sp. BB307]
MRIGALLWVTVVGVTAALQANGLVPNLPRLEPFAWAFSLVVIGVDNAGSLVVRRWEDNRAILSRKIETALMALLIGLVKGKKELRFEELGANVYTVSWLDKTLQRSDEARRLKRIKRFRPGYPQQSGIRWTPRTGTVGQCWSERREVHWTGHNLAKRHAGTSFSEEEFLNIRKDTRQGFTREEFQSIVGKYSEILAVPIWHPQKDGKMLGVLTIDRAYKQSDDVFVPMLAKSGESAAATASVVARNLISSDDSV